MSAVGFQSWMFVEFVFQVHVLKVRVPDGGFTPLAHQGEA